MCIRDSLADVELLLPPGTESHSYEPTPADILKVQSCDLFLYLGGDSDQWVETILEAAEPTGRTLALIDCVETLEEEHVEGMQEEVGHHHDEDEDDHDHDHLGTVTEIDEHVWTAPANAAAITQMCIRDRPWSRPTAGVSPPITTRMARSLSSACPCPPPVPLFPLIYPRRKPYEHP